MSSNVIPIDTRRCADCHASYSRSELEKYCPQYFEQPYRYADGAHRVCLACWLGAGESSGNANGKA